MQNLCQIGRRYWCLIWTSILLALIVVNPLAGVAQNAAQKKDDAKISQDASRMPADQKSVAKLIVGAWNVGGEGESKLIVFNQDGRYEDRGVNLFCEEQEVRSGEPSRMEQFFVASQGTWQMQDNQLVLENKDRVAFWDKTQDDGDRSNATCRFEILRLDDSLLRLRLVPKQTTQRGTFFFRRTEEKSIDKEFSAVPPEFRRVLAAAEMTPDEAAAMVDWLKAQKLDSPAQLEVIDRLLQARRHQITLAQLFGMSNEEAAAFRDVVKQVAGDYERLVSLATSDLLTPTERKAVDKATSVVTDLRRLTEELPMDVQTRVSVYGRAGAAMTRQLERDAIMAANGQGIAEFQGGLGLQPGQAGNTAAAFADAVAQRGRGAAAAENAPAPGVAPAAARGGRAATAAGRRGGRGRGVLLGSNTDTLDATQREAVTKLNGALGSVGAWFWRTVFPTE
jgi:hypothetical protein